MRHVRAIPVQLIVLCFVTVAVGLAWTVIPATFNQPDEPEHAARVALTAEGLPTPTGIGRNYSSAQEPAVFSGGGADLYGNTERKVSWDPEDEATYRRFAAAVTRAQRRNVNGRTVATENPRTYYLVTGIAYRLGGDFLTRLWAMRAMGVLWLLATVVGAWLLVGEVFGRDRLLQLTAGGFVALEPMLGNISAAVNPDGMLIGASTLLLWLGVRLLRRGATAGRILALLAMTGLACAVKTSAFAFVPAVLIAVGWTMWRRRHPEARPGLRRVVLTSVSGVALLAVVYLLLRAVADTLVPQLAGTIRGVDNVREFLSYVFQFYFGRPSFLTPSPGLGPENRFWITWVQQSWGVFGAVDTTLAPALYRTLFWAGGVAIVLAVLAIWRRRRSIDWPVVVFLGLTVVSLLAGLHVTEYRVLVAGGGPFLQGRYLLPVIGVGALVVAAAVSALSRPNRPLLAGLILGGALGLELLAMSTVMIRFYAA